MKNLLDNFTNKISEIFGKEKLPKKVAVAVSGGSDSLALTLLLNEFCQQKNIDLFAVTVDHKMRQSSAGEAQKLQKILQKKKISHQILEISAKKIPQKNIEAKLRELRYQMLGDFCKKNKIKHLFLGHQIDDVAENFLIRLFRGSGLDGLSTIAESSESNGIKLLRPLLNVEKSELQNFLQEQKVQWFEDETNQDEKFLRNKIRKFFGSFEEKNLIQKRVKNASDEIAKMRDFFDDILLTQAKKILKFKGGYFLIEKEKFSKIEEKIALKILALILMEIGGKAYKPRLEKLKNFYNHLIAKGKIKPRNFYGCMAKEYDEKHIVVFSERENSDIILRTILKNIF